MSLSLITESRLLKRLDGLLAAWDRRISFYHTKSLSSADPVWDGYKLALRMARAELQHELRETREEG